MKRRAIILVSCGLFEKRLIQEVVSLVEKEFSLPVELRECTLDISLFYNPGRRQYDANKFLKAMCDRVPEDALKVMGMARVDLYIPILTYIFGQARLNGYTGLVSLYRLRNEHYGLKRDDGLLTERFGKVVVHELGHTFGLIHCQNPVCVMRSSTYVEDLDQKEHHFCPACRKALTQRIDQLIEMPNTR